MNIDGLDKSQTHLETKCISIFVFFLNSEAMNINLCDQLSWQIHKSHDHFLPAAKSFF